MSKSIMLIIEGHIYDVTYFQNKHPGEGIRNTYLYNYNRKDVTTLFKIYHDVGYEIIYEAKKTGEHKGVKYISPNFYDKKLPKCLYPDLNYPIDILKDMKHDEYILTPDSQSPQSIIVLYVKQTNCFIKENIMIEDKRFVIRTTSSRLSTNNIENNIKKRFCFNTISSFMEYMTDNKIKQYIKKTEK